MPPAAVNEVTKTAFTLLCCDHRRLVPTQWIVRVENVPHMSPTAKSATDELTNGSLIGRAHKKVFTQERKIVEN